MLISERYFGAKQVNMLITNNLQFIKGLRPTNGHEDGEQNGPGPFGARPDRRTCSILVPVDLD
jgi:hypothetical protein